MFSVVNIKLGAFCPVHRSFFWSFFFFFVATVRLPAIVSTARLLQQFACINWRDFFSIYRICDRNKKYFQLYYAQGMEERYLERIRRNKLNIFYKYSTLSSHSQKCVSAQFHSKLWVISKHMLHWAFRIKFSISYHSLMNLLTLTPNFFLFSELRIFFFVSNRRHTVLHTPRKEMKIGTTILFYSWFKIFLPKQNAWLWNDNKPK